MIAIHQVLTITEDALCAESKVEMANGIWNSTTEAHDRDIADVRFFVVKHDIHIVDGTLKPFWQIVLYDLNIHHIHIPVHASVVHHIVIMIVQIQSIDELLVHIHNHGNPFMIHLVHLQVWPIGNDYILSQHVLAQPPVFGGKLPHALLQRCIGLAEWKSLTS